MKNNNILKKLTYKDLKLNRSRTIMTILGIMLSTAMITAIAGLATSFQQTIINQTIRQSGNYHTEYLGVKSENVTKITDDSDLESSYISKDIGYSEFEKSEETRKDYLFLSAFTESGLENGGINLTEGTLPKSDDEVVISEDLKTSDDSYKVGDIVTLDLFRRYSSDGDLLGQTSDSYIFYDEEQTAPIIIRESLYKKDYKIVGKIEKPSIESFGVVGYSAITLLANPTDTNSIVLTKNLTTEPSKSSESELEESDETVPESDETVPESNETNSDEAVELSDSVTQKIEEYSKIIDDFNNVFVLLKHPSQHDAFADKIQKEINQENPTITHKHNRELLMWQGTGMSVENMAVIFGFLGALILIVTICSIFIIRNSFAVSISEKQKLYGMLASIGATRKQIKKNVLYEGFLLGLIAIPLGIISGAIVVATFIWVINEFFSEELEMSHFVINIPLLPIALGAVLTAITIYISTIMIARKASKISAIEAIRSSSDIKIKAKKLRTPKYINKIFGMGGVIAYKNMKRNKSKYRIVTISLSLSVLIFIVLSSFIKFGLEMTKFQFGSYDYNITISQDYSSSRNNNDNDDDRFAIYKEFSKLDNIEEFSIERSAGILVDKKYHTDFYNTLFISGEPPVLEVAPDSNPEFDPSKLTDFTLLSIGEEEYKIYIKKLGLDYDDIKDKIILINNGSAYDTTGDKAKTVYGDIYNLKEHEKFEGVLEPQINYSKNELMKLEKSETFEIGKITEIAPLSISQGASMGMSSASAIISDEMMDKLDWSQPYTLYIKTKNADSFEKKFDEIKQSNTTYAKYRVTNYDDMVKQANMVIMLISILFYGFIGVITLISLTSVFNTITTSIALRAKDFAILQSIGMTSKEFKKLVNLESIFIGIKALIIGLPLGIIGSLLVFHYTLKESGKFEYTLPLLSIIISIFFVFIIIYLIMRYSMKKINKQNIIETIRNDNV
ncbi:MAG: ABC transporter permease [Bifidobacteriaceae bacterium]|jgi:putative ABC transport system permease protein|nr:ABC transporter permease [Bifidobacteriaceae bacterium]